LVAFYNALDGPHWTNQTNWLQPGKMVGEWYGIKVDEGRVLEIVFLTDNNLKGQIPEDIGNLTALINIFIVGNNISDRIPASIKDLSFLQLMGIESCAYRGEIPASVFQIKGPPPPNITQRQFTFRNNYFTSIDYRPAPGYNIMTLLIEGNAFDFADLEPLIGTIQGNFRYAPQRPIYTADELTLHPNAKVTLKTLTGGSANNYQWFKNGAPIALATETTYTTQVAMINDGEVITSSVTNPICPDLTLQRNPITLHVANPVITDCNANTLTLEAGTLDPQATFIWSNGATTRTITVNASGRYSVHIETPNYIADDTLEVVLPNTLTLAYTPDPCEPTAFIAANIPNADTYTWQTPSGIITGKQSVTATVNGEYTLTITKDGCQKNATVTATLGSKTEGSFTVHAGDIPVSEDEPTLTGISLTFTNTTGSGTGYAWNFDGLGNAESDVANYSFAQPGTYTVTLTGTDSRNCPVTITRQIHVEQLWLADAMTINNDAKNDTWKVYPLRYEPELKVMDRYGRTVYFNEHYANDFTAQGLEEGVYYFDLVLKSVRQHYKGFINILKN
jgi:hypothetical protein